MTLSLERELDALYQAPLPDFVRARNDLAANLRKSGEAEAANAVKAIAKPSLSAWALNQLYWKRRDVFDELVDASEAFRRAQSSALERGGTPIDREQAEARRTKALREALQAAQSVLAEAGASRSESVLRRIEGSLEAIGSHGSRHPVDGRLSGDVAPPGFGALAGIAGAPLVIGRAAEAATPAGDEAVSIKNVARELAARTLSEREEELRGAREERERAKQRAREAEERLEEARRRLAVSEEQLTDARTRAEQAQARVEEREARVEAARSSFDAIGKPAE